MTVIPSPNIWHWPELYELENQVQDADGAIFSALREIADWTGKDVVDVGCGTGFHLPMFAEHARSVVGVEPHPPLVRVAQRRFHAAPRIRVLRGTAETLPLSKSSADVVHARTAYFFGAKSGPGIREAMRVLRPGGALVVVDLDATAHPYGEWMRADAPHYDAAGVERFFDDAGFDIRRVDTRWVFPNRDALARVLGIEFTERTAARAYTSTSGLGLDVRYRIHWRHKRAGFWV